MNILFENLETLIDAPNGIEKARELILQLAVQGKLTEQDPNDEPASELLKKIKKEKDKLIAEGKIRKQNDVEPINDNEKPFELPKGWEWSYLSNCTFITMGQSPSSQYYNTKGEGIPFYQGKTEFGSVFLTPRKWCSKPQKIAQDGDILISVRAPVGPTNINQNISCIGRGLASISTLNIFNNYYLLFFLRSIEERIASLGVGSTFKAISLSHLNQLMISLPPIKEQKRIVEKVNSLMALLDELEEKRDNRNQKRIKLNNASLDKLITSKDDKELKINWYRIEENFRTLYSAPENVKKLKQAILQLAVQGKLVKQDPNDEPASELLKKIKQEKEKLIAEGKIKKQNEFTPIKEEEKPFELPKGWKWVRLQEVFDVRDGTHDTPKYIKDGIPLVTSRCFFNGEIDFSLAQNISRADHNEIQKRSYVEVHDILFSMIGGNLGNMIMVKTDKEFSIKNVALFKYYNKELTLPNYLYLFLQFLASGIQKKAAGGAQPFVALSFLRNHLFSLPPIKEQKRIVEKVNELMSLCNALEEKLKKKEETAERLVGAVVNAVANKSIKPKPDKETIIKELIGKHKKALEKLS